MIRSKFGRVFVAVVALGMVVAGSTAQATILTFDMSPWVANEQGGFEPAGNHHTYGDNVTATSMPGALGTNYLYGMGNGFTPDITIDYTHNPSAAAGNWHSVQFTEGSWADPVDYLRYQDGTVFWFTFTPTGDNGVDINSFAIDMYGGSGELNWKLREDSTTGTIFASGTESALLASDPDRIVTIPDGSYYGTVVLEINFTTVPVSFGTFGIDDLNFDQLAPPPIPAPEPATNLLLAIGGLGMVARRQRRSTDQRE